MSDAVILASGSAIRRAMLDQVGCRFSVVPAQVDEPALRDSILNDGGGPGDVALELAQAKAQSVSRAHPGSLVIGADQVLVLEDELFAKPVHIEDARMQLRQMQGRSHTLISAACISENGAITWKAVKSADLTMRRLSDDFIEDYTTTYWDSIRHTVGCYQVEGPGIALFSGIEGDYHVVLGMPLFELLSCLIDRGVLKQ